MKNETDVEREDEGYPSLTLNVDKYLPELEDTDLSDAEKQEFLAALWSILVAFVELGFGIDPVQNACGQVAKEYFEATKNHAVDVEFEEHSSAKKFDTAAPSGKGNVEKGAGK